ncbi:hypothetical protein [Saccharopolyspora flava]|uniref:MFS transporter, ACS family, D-galactonate transporter n=1 Tax=Saccharopolyspora flava TaxID=95161 RepID=A0A1I6TM42_9PSEU|nr:hypothetical protein [Saccharopolyspora flava]SFS90201.1 MFS transporter, ACS family, D-galactonate transporter [Saccharopolyspora flava]
MRSPARRAGRTGGALNFIGNLSSIATPIVIGFLVTDESFTPAFGYMPAITVAGILLSYAFLVGRVERVPERIVIDWELLITTCQLVTQRVRA